MNSKAQLGGIVLFVFVLLGLILIAPIILKVGVTILDQTTAQLGNVDATNKSAVQTHFVRDKLTGTMDWMVMLLVIINILVLMVSAFLIDINPAFLVIYILGVFALVLTAPYTVASAEKLYSMSDFTGSTGVIQYIPMTEFMLNNFGVIIVGVIVLTGIIMYSKIKFFSAGGTSGTY